MYTEELAGVAEDLAAIERMIAALRLAETITRESRADELAISTSRLAEKQAMVARMTAA